MQGHLENEFGNVVDAKRAAIVLRWFFNDAAGEIGAYPSALAQLQAHAEQGGFTSYARDGDLLTERRVEALQLAKKIEARLSRLPAFAVRTLRTAYEDTTATAVDGLLLGFDDPSLVRIALQSKALRVVLSEQNDAATAPTALDFRHPPFAHELRKDFEATRRHAMSALWRERRGWFRLLTREVRDGTAARQRCALRAHLLVCAMHERDEALALYYATGDCE
jgi:hypothetical protein